jgi:uncharacterized protein (DUF2141 family)
VIHVALAFAALISIGNAFAAELVVRVSGISDGAGMIRVAACSEAEFLKSCRLTGTAAARRGSVDVTIRAVPSGRYAIQAFHDRDGDGKLKTNLIGMPTEPFGFSRSPRMNFGPPSFADAAIDVDARTIVVPIALRS